MSRSGLSRDIRARTGYGGLYNGIAMYSGSTPVEYVAVLPSNYNPASPKTGIVFCHAFGTDETSVVGQPNASAVNGMSPITFALVRAGYPILSLFYDNTWGNAASSAVLDSAKTLIQSGLGAKSGAIGLMGASMGGLTCLNWARANLADTAFYIGLVPASSMSSLIGLGGSVADSINAAYGGAYVEGTHGATRNPTTYASTDLTGLDAKMWYGATDNVAIPATITNLATLIGGTASAVSVTGGHFNALQNVPVADVVSFANANQT